MFPVKMIENDVNKTKQTQQPNKQKSDSNNNAKVNPTLEFFWVVS